MKYFILVFLFSINIWAACNTSFDPKTVADFDKTKVSFNGLGISGTVPANTNDYAIDLAMTDDNLLTGAKLIITNGCSDDKIKLQVVDTTGQVAVPYRVAFPRYPILSEFINWYASDMDTQLTYPSKISCGLTLRALYTNTCSTSVKSRVNFHLHKVLL